MNKQHKMPFPLTDPLIDCFELVISDAEAAFLIRMGKALWTYPRLEALSGMPGTRFRPFFSGLERKGLVWQTQTHLGASRYHLAGIMLGWFELQLCRARNTPEEKAFAQALNQLFDSWARLNRFPTRNFYNFVAPRRHKPLQSVAATGIKRQGNATVIPVNRSVQPAATRVYSSDTVQELIARYGKRDEIALLHCFCRQWRRLTHNACRNKVPLESCLALGPLTLDVERHQFGRRISAAEAFDVIAAVRKAGAVHLVFHEDEDVTRPHIAICNCCWDCCGVLSSYNRGIIPLHFRAYYLARFVDPDGCTGCGRCARFCPVGAIEMVAGRPALTEKKCIGCGQCAVQCPAGCVEMARNARTVFLPLLKPSEARLPLNQASDGAA